MKQKLLIISLQILFYQ